MTRSLQGMELLLVEDNFLILYETKLILEEAGATVTTAGSVKECLPLCEADYHVAILDIDLPDGTVQPVAERLHMRQTPLIFHSGSTDNPAIFRQFPDAVILIKPASENQLVASVHKQALASGRQLGEEPGSGAPQALARSPAGS